MGKKSTAIKLRIIETRRDKRLNAIIFEMAMDNMPEKYVEQAKKIDGEAYAEECFAFQFRFSIGTNRFFVNEVGGKEAYYIDENGDKHYLDYKIPQNLTNIAIDQCNCRLQKMGIKKRRSARAKKEKEVAK